MKTATLILAEKSMKESGASTGLIAALVGIAASTLRDALRDESYLGSEREAEIQRVASRLAEVKEALEPLGLPREVSDVMALVQSAKTSDELRRLVSAMFEHPD
jgi:hypothetical protein